MGSTPLGQALSGLLLSRETARRPWGLGLIGHVPRSREMSRQRGTGLREVGWDRAAHILVTLSTWLDPTLAVSHPGGTLAVGALSYECLTSIIQYLLGSEVS